MTAALTPSPDPDAEAQSSFEEIIESIVSKPLNTVQSSLLSALQKHEAGNLAELDRRLAPLHGALGNPATMVSTTVLGRIGDPAQPYEHDDTLAAMIRAAQDALGDPVRAKAGEQTLAGKMASSEQHLTDLDAALRAAEECIMARLGDPMGAETATVSLASMLQLALDRVGDPDGADQETSSLVGRVELNARTLRDIERAVAAADSKAVAGFESLQRDSEQTAESLHRQVGRLTLLVSLLMVLGVVQGAIAGYVALAA